MYQRVNFFMQNLKFYGCSLRKIKKHMHKYLQPVQTLCKFAVVSPVSRLAALKTH